MKLSHLKLNLFYLQKACLEYRSPLAYIFYRYIVAPKILNSSKISTPTKVNDDLSIHILSCHRDLIMMLWSLASFYNYTSISGQLFIHSDGTLTSHDKFLINKLFPESMVIEPKYFLKTNTHKLKQYPVVYKFRTEYPEYFLLAKLLDPYFVSDKKLHLIIDTDLLWFNSPTAIEEEIKKQAEYSLITKGTGIACPVYFKDNTQLDSKLAQLNSGIVLYHKDNFNLDKLTKYLEKIDTDNPKNKHFIEQAGYASVLENITVLPEDKYIIKGQVDKTTIVKHYTSPRRPLFYIEGLKKLSKKFL